MSLTKKDIDLIQALLEDSQFDRLSVEIDGVKVELARSGAAPKKVAQAPAPASAPVAAPPSGRARQSTEEGLIVITDLSPVVGERVNITPAHSASTIRCTTTAIATPSSGKSCFRR